ncbi:MAG: hypothetical protein GQ583_05345 [Methyloprofundus sp.]|nr:hypothetical protein [Methyloprofundus sp.]
MKSPYIGGHNNDQLCSQCNTAFALLLAVTFTMLPLIAEAQDLLTRPDPAGTPTKVQILLALLDIDEIDGAQQSFTANVYIRVRWQDPRLIATAGTDRNISLKQAWHPIIQIINRQHLRTSFPEGLSVRKKGIIYQQRYWGQFSNPLSLRDFPLDQHNFEVRVVVANPVSEVQIVDFDDPKVKSTLADQLSIADWEIISWDTSIENYHLSTGFRPLSSYVFHFTAKRKLGYYIVQVIIPLTLIVMMSWIVFWLTPSESGTQISIAITSVLTLIAYRFTIGNELPHISYLTRMDVFLMGATILVFGALLEAALTSRFMNTGNLNLTVKMDWWSRIIFPLCFTGLISFAFLL